MSRMMAAMLGAAMLLTAVSVARAHEGHVHGPEPAVKVDASPRGYASSALFELVAIAQGGELVIYLDRFASNEPVRDAEIEVETPEGPVSATAADGVYRLKAPWLARPGHVDLIVTVTSGGETDILPLTLDISDPAMAKAEPTEWKAHVTRILQPVVGLAAGIGFALGVILMALRRRAAPTAVLLILTALSGGQIRAHEGHVHGSPQQQVSGSDRASRGGDGTVFVPKPIQRIFDLRTVVAETGTHYRSVELPGRIIPDPNASGFVQTAVGGRLSPPPGGFPRLGTPVKPGDVLAHVTPPMQQIDVSDMRQRQGELDQQIAIVERRLHRYERLAPTGAIAQIQLEETRLELEGLRERRGSLDKVRREPEALVAPVAGVIAEGTPVPGQIAQPNAVVFQIVDPRRHWIEALSFEAVAPPRSATALTASGSSLPLVFKGSALTDRSQSVAVQFDIEGENNGLRAGQFVTVFLTTDDERKGIAIPRSGVVRGANGQDVVYIHTAPERFEAKTVRFEPLDGERVLVLAGIEPGARIVVQGTELVDHVR
jgi:cobalt-zinc-cadmium efflux system membrane fusion protein